MGTTAPAVSIDRFRRRKAAELEASRVPAPEAHPLSGTALGTLERRYGLMSSTETIVVDEVVATSGDLAVADRLAFLAAIERHAAIAVIEVDGWFIACTTERTIAPAELAALRAPVNGGPRIMSLVTDRGITPALGPLVA